MLIYAFGAMGALFGQAVPAVHAGTITKPYTFNSGDVISSSQMNSDFDTLYTEINNKDSRITALEALTPVSKAGDTMTGALILSADPTAALGAATKQYVDAHAGAAAGVTNFNSRTGAVTLTSGDVTSALGGLPVISIGTANGLTISGSAISLGVANSIATGALTSSDWIAFNSKLGTSGGTITGSLTVNTGATGNKGIIIQGVAGQSAHLTEWQNSGGTVLASIDTAGRFIGDGSQLVNIVIPWASPGTIGSSSPNSGTFLSLNATNLTLNGSQNNSITNPVETVAASTGQTAPLTEWLNASLTVMSVVDLNGNIGIGTSSPTAPLQILGSGPATTAVQITNGNVGIGTSAASAQLHVVPPNANKKPLIVQGFSAQSADLQDWMGSNGTVLAFVNSTGNIGIGTTSASAPLMVYLNASGTAVATFQSTSGNCSIVPITSTLSCSSDIRLKEDIRPLTDSLAKVLATTGVSFHWRKLEGPGRNVGFIAQDLEKNVPELVTVDADGFKQVAYAPYVAVLNEAMKEMHAKFTEELNQLHAENTELRRRVARLERDLAVSTAQ